ncbi:serine hydrolase [Agriterribacter sp.]|uniref:serine hydrolase domain-containing protein n=1 Tax=Agriterribacter sp. TaxID=2821509 RepID=UPI002D0847FC|nr:serine hydrolase [Agriterribacter sp.]HTN06392.1 serine hydrolase [Agriterribacter sp.]
MKKNKNRSAKFILIALLVILVLPVLTGKTYLYKAIVYNFAGIDDYTIFNNRSVPAAQPVPWRLSADYGKIIIPDTLEQYLTKLQSVGLVVVQNREIVVEKYWNSYSDSSLSNSFSVAKSITSLLTGAAIHEGKIGSVSDPVGKYLPAFNEGEKAKVKIVDLLTMSSGSNWNESYANPLSETTELYYGTDLYTTATRVNIIKAPGTYHAYKSGDTQLLGLVVEKATGKSLSAYAAEKLWQPLGAAHSALWSIDKPDGDEKAYCCFNSNARDFARLGQLMLDSGKINGVPVIDSVYFSQSVTPCKIMDEYNTPCNYYGYQWWIIPGRQDIFYARGILGQYIICIPSRHMVIVRLGEKRDEKINNVPIEVNTLIAWAERLDESRQ